MTDTVVVIYSGGMDSYTLLHLARARGFKVHALSFNYGQRHVRELECAASVAEHDLPDSWPGLLEHIVRTGTLRAQEILAEHVADSVSCWAPGLGMLMRKACE